MTKQEDKTPIYKKWQFWVVVVAVLGLIGAASNSSKSEDLATGTKPAETTASNTSEEKTEEKASGLFTENEMIMYCQDDHATDIKGYFNSLGINMVIEDGWNANEYFNAEDGTVASGEYAGRTYASLSWNGKNKDNGKVISFLCYATKDEAGNKHLISLQADLVNIRGSIDTLYAN